MTIRFAANNRTNRLNTLGGGLSRRLSRLMLCLLPSLLLVSSCSKLHETEAQFMPQSLTVADLNPKGSLYVTWTAQMRDNSSFKQHLESLNIDGTLWNSGEYHDGILLPPDIQMQLTGKIVRYRHSLPEKVIGGSDQPACYYELLWHNQRLLIFDLMTPEFYRYDCQTLSD